LKLSGRFWLGSFFSYASVCEPAVAGSFVVLSVLLVLPADSENSIWALTTSKSDAYGILWNIFAFRSAIAAATNPLFSDWLFHPFSVAWWVQGYTPLPGCWHLLDSNPYRAINTFVVLQYSLSGYGAWRLGRQLGLSIISSYWVGVIFAFSTYKLVHHPEHYNLILTGFLPFYLSTFLNTFGRSPSFSRAAGLLYCLCWGILVALCDYSLAYFLIVFSCLYLISHYWIQLSIGKQLFVLVGCHFLVRLLIRLQVPAGEGFYWGAKTIQLLVPPSQSSIWHWQTFTDWYTAPWLRGNIESVIFLGSSLWLLLIIARKKVFHQSKCNFLIISLLLFMLPTVGLTDQSWFHPPTALLHFIPVIQEFRCPGRMIILVQLVLAISVARALATHRFHTLLCIMGILITLIEFIPYQKSYIHAADLPASVYQIRQLPGQVVLTLPTGMRDGKQETGFFPGELVWYQTVFQKKLIGGITSRIPETVMQLYANEPVLKWLQQISISDTNTKIDIPDTIQHQFKVFLDTFKVDIIWILPSHAHLAVAIDKLLLLSEDWQRFITADHSYIWVRTC
jgi:hypothetical protein